MSIEERYKLAYGAHQHASDYRAGIVKGWCAMYAALAAVFVWVQNSARPLSCIVTFIGIFTTIVMWLADVRNRSAIGASMEVGRAIENDGDLGIKNHRVENGGINVEESQRFFNIIKTQGEASWLKNTVTHSWIINITSIVIIVALSVATYLLFVSEGQLTTISKKYAETRLRAHIIKLGVADMKSTLRLYRDGLELPTPEKGNEPNNIVYFNTNGAVLALYPKNKLKQYINLKQTTGLKFQSTLITYLVNSEQEVKETVYLAEKYGAIINKKPSSTQLGKYSGIFTDKDGHYWEVAYWKNCKFNKDGSIVIEQ